MESWQERVLEEYNTLKDKTGALYVFLASAGFRNLDDENQHLLKQQYYSMMVYAGILEQRIALFQKD